MRLLSDITDERRRVSGNFKIRIEAGDNLVTGVVGRSVIIELPQNSGYIDCPRGNRHTGDIRIHVNIHYSSVAPHHYVISSIAGDWEISRTYDNRIFKFDQLPFQIFTHLRRGDDLRQDFNTFR